MHIVIAGGSGFLGGHLADRLARDGDEVVVLTRGQSSASGRVRFVSWIPDDSTGPWATEIDGAGAVVNLAGESIAARRWSVSHKQRILDSRIHSTRSLVVAINKAGRRPAARSASGESHSLPRANHLITTS